MLFERAKHKNDCGENDDDSQRTPHDLIAELVVEFVGSRIRVHLRLLLTPVVLHIFVHVVASSSSSCSAAATARSERAGPKRTAIPFAAVVVLVTLWAVVIAKVLVVVEARRAAGVLRPLSLERRR